MTATVSGGESVIAVPVELPVALRRLRDRLDPSAADGVPAHITLIYPFAAPDAVDAAVIESLARIVALEAAFPFVLRRVERWPTVVYLPPDPSEPFIRLTRALAEAFPEFPPYGGAHEKIVPHVTIASTNRTDYLDAAEHASPGLLPVHAHAREAWLMGHIADRPWQTIARLPLRQGT